MSKPSRPRMPRIVNRGDWFVAILIEQFELVGADRKNDRRRGRVWENVVLLNAPDISAAYDKAVALGRMCETDESWHDDRGRRFRHVFVGVADLLPMYDDLEDEAEVMWTDHGQVSVSRAKRMVRTRRELVGRFKQKGT